MLISDDSRSESDDPFVPAEDGDDSTERAELSIEVGDWVVEHSAPARYTPVLTTGTFLAVGPGITLWLATGASAPEWVTITVVTIQVISLVILSRVTQGGGRAR